MADGGALNYLSLFTGCGTDHLALHPLGWRCAGVAEIDANACLVLAHRLNASRPKYMPSPNEEGIDAHERRNRQHALRKVAGLPAYGTSGTLPNLGDVSRATDEDVRALGHIDVVLGGSPCQDLSVAGKRAGLEGARSRLFHHQSRIFHVARKHNGARWLWWENVPGAFSSNRGGDFAVVVGTLAGGRIDRPAQGWESEGVALGRNGLVEWAVLDAQWFGVAQRRRRVFAVLDTGNWTDRPPVLLEPDSVRGDSAPRRAAGESVTGTLESRLGRSGVSADFAASGGLIGCLAHGQGQAEVTSGEHAPTLTCNHEAPIVAHTLRADGFDASEDGTGRGIPLVPRIAFDTTQITSPTNGSNPQPDDPCHTLAAGAAAPAIAFDCKASGRNGFAIGDVASTQRAMGHANSHHNGGVHQAVMQGAQVRRLTPRECERLQGLEDDWTLVPNHKGQPMADGPRYRMIGNGFARPVIEWIGRQIQSAHSYQRIVA